MFIFTKPGITAIKQLVFPALYFTEVKAQNVKYVTAHLEMFVTDCF